MFALDVCSHIVFVSHCCCNTSPQAVWFQTTQIYDDSAGGQGFEMGLSELKSRVGSAVFFWELEDKPFPYFSQLLEVTVVAYAPFLHLQRQQQGMGPSPFHIAVSPVLSTSPFHLQ